MNSINPYEKEELQSLPGSLLRPGGLELTENLVLQAGLHAGARILDAGCGLGGSVRFCRELGYDAVGVDISETLIERGRTLQNGAVLIAASAEALPFGEKSFDAVLFECSLSLMNADAALREAGRILKPGGRLMISDVFAGIETAPTDSGMCLRTQAEFNALLLETGFEVTGFEDKTIVFESFIAQLIMSTGSLASLFDCCEWSDIKKAKPRYCLVSARKD